MKRMSCSIYRYEPSRAAVGATCAQPCSSAERLHCTVTRTPLPLPHTPYHTLPTLPQLGGAGRVNKSTTFSYYSRGRGLRVKNDNQLPQPTTPNLTYSGDRHAVSPRACGGRRQRRQYHRNSTTVLGATPTRDAGTTRLFIISPRDYV